MILVLDTNVLLRNHNNYWELQDFILENSSPPFKFLIAVDEGDVIEDEYLEYAINAGEETPIRVITEKLLNNDASFIQKINLETSDRLNRLFERLAEIKCNDPIQPELFAVAQQCSGILVCPNSKECDIPRDYLEIEKLVQIQIDEACPDVRPIGELIHLLRQPHEYSPEDTKDLQILLSNYKIADKSSEEREFLEFKCPKGNYLSRTMLRNVVRTVCGFLNHRSGWIFIGVDDKTGEINPFPPRYGNNKKPISVDNLILDIRAEINLIRPRPGGFVHVWPIKDHKGSENYVIGIFVRQGNPDWDYLYRDKHIETMLVKLLRIGTNVEVDPNWTGTPIHLQELRHSKQHARKKS